jgi:hypothetical protein
VKVAWEASLGPGRPEGEIWEIVLTCGHKLWRPRKPGKNPSGAYCRDCAKGKK